MGLTQITHADGFASIISGMRRCGKSTVQLQIQAKYFKDKGLFLHFEDPRLSNIESSDFERLYNEIQKRKTKILFFDEIQIVKGWEFFVNQLLREDFHLFITGSNATLLSKELGTHLTGRHFSNELFPFSYKEYLDYKNLTPNENSFSNYLQEGGMPDFLRTGEKKYLNDLLNDILIRDISVHHGIRDVNSLRQLAVYLLSNIGNLVSANSLSGMFGIKSGTTIMDYFSYLQDAYLVDFVPMFDYSVKKQIRNPQKIYATDLGIYHQNKITFSPNEGYLLENAVYLHLRRQGHEIYYFKNKGECDFITTHNGIPENLLYSKRTIKPSNLFQLGNG
ncbi:MAG: ATP-binding protein [Porphyromonadaceae bacterium]|nr:ATP-binding protein [Porphyromonadaceae bacterium]